MTVWAVDIDHLESLAKAAGSQGPWQVGHDGQSVVDRYASLEVADSLYGTNARFVAAAHPTAIQALIARIRAADNQTSALRERVRDLESEINAWREQR